MIAEVTVRKLTYLQTPTARGTTIPVLQALTKLVEVIKHSVLAHQQTCKNGRGFTT